MKLYNSQTQNKKEFKTINIKKVLMYVCGITPYDTTHLGHAFTYVFFDTLGRYLKFKGYEVNYTQNVTDIDDDILKKADATKKNWIELGEYWTDRFLNDLKSLNVLIPTNFVKATESISTMIQTIDVLVKKDFAYVRSGSVYFNVNKFPEYGKLSHFNKNQMLSLSKERGANPQDPNKINPLDFILWQKKIKDNEPSWDSPWGEGRPGWHIECSVMINKYLGPQIDIHGGGRDLIYPHHESEIAQSESFTGQKPFVKYWMHTAMLMYQGEKMSKSLGNLVMVADLLKTYDPNAIRWLLLSHHYRITWEYSHEEIDAAQKIIEKIKNLLNNENIQEDINQEYWDKFTSYLDDDMNTPQALEIIKETLKNKQTFTLQQMTNLLGFKFYK